MNRKRLLYGLLVFILIIAGCNVPGNDHETQTYQSLEQTIEANMTCTAESVPTDVPTETLVPTEVPSAVPEDIPPIIERTDGTSEEDQVPLIRRDPDAAQGSEDDSGLISRGVTPLPEPTATEKVVFPDKAEFVSVLPSPNQFIPDQTFYLTWEVRNTGTSNWSGKYKFYHTDGVRLATESSFAIDSVVEPGGILRISMPAKAPSEKGSYKTAWALENPDGIVFYNLYYNLTVGDVTYITALPGSVMTATPSGTWWMCTDPERSKIYGDGCLEYCNADVIAQLAVEGKQCYSYGEAVK